MSKQAQEVEETTDDATRLARGALNDTLNSISLVFLVITFFGIGFILMVLDHLAVIQLSPLMAGFIVLVGGAIEALLFELFVTKAIKHRVQEMMDIQKKKLLNSK